MCAPLVPAGASDRYLPRKADRTVLYGAIAGAVETFLRVLFASLRRRALERRRIRYAHAGAVSFVQRFGDALNLNVHFHVLARDGVFDADDPDKMFFVPLDPPSDTEILRVALGFARRLARVLKRRGLGAESHDDDPLLRDQPLMAELCGASVRGQVATGPRAGQRVRRLGDRIEVEHLLDSTPSGCARVGGITVHAAVAVPARDRRRLERLCRYAARPALASERLSLDPEARLVYRLRHPWRDGTTHLLLEPLELMERLAVLAPPPRFHLVRYHGILAPRAAWRDRAVLVLPHPHENPDPAHSGQANADAPDRHVTERQPAKEPARARRGGRLPWAQLLQRVFAAEALTCPRCGQPMRVLAAIQTPEAIRAILECLNLPARPPPIAPPAIGALLPADA
jgi:hypothetical protein